MKRYPRTILVAVLSLALIGAFALFGCSTQQPDQNQGQSQNQEQQASETVQLQIFAANSLTKAMDEVQKLYAKSHSNITFADTQYKSSGELNEMLAAGSYADILISASKGKMDDAATAGYINQNTRFDMFKNDLVMVTATNSNIEECTLQDIAEGKYTVAVGDESVPAGNYADQSLYSVGCYSNPEGIAGEFTGALAEPGKVVLDSSVGNVCKHAESGDVDIAFVYTSDVYRFGGVKVVGTVPANTHKAIVYPAAITTDSKYSQEAGDFLEWATTNQDAIQVWQKWGFELVA